MTRALLLVVAAACAGCVDDLVSECARDTDCTGTKRCNEDRGRCEPPSLGVDGLTNAVGGVILDDVIYGLGQTGECPDAEAVVRTQSLSTVNYFTSDLFGREEVLTAFKGRPGFITAVGKRLLVVLTTCDGVTELHTLTSDAQALRLTTLAESRMPIVAGEQAFAFEISGDWARLGRIPHDAAAETTITDLVFCRPATSTITAIGLNSTHVFWSDGYRLQSALRSPDCVTGETDPILAPTTEDARILSIAVHEDRIVWLEGRWLRDAPLDATGQLAGSITKGDWQGVASSVHVDGDGIYWLDEKASETNLVMRPWASESGPPMTLASDVGMIAPLTSTDSHVVYVNKSGSSTTAVIAQLKPGP